MSFIALDLKKVIKILIFGFFYRLKTKSTKWYRRILFHFVDVSLVNSFIMCKEVFRAPKMPLYVFKLEVATSLMYMGNLPEPLAPALVALQQVNKKAKNGDPVGERTPPDEVRLDRIDHWPEAVAVRARCCRVKGCQQRSTFWCTKCKVYLCVKREKNCFAMFHRGEEMAE